jgi:hypothetical protein
MAFTGADLQAGMVIFASVFAYFKLKYKAKMIDDANKLLRAILAVGCAAFLLGLEPGTVINILFFGGALYYVLANAFGLGAEGGLAAMLATALAWAFATG